MISIKQARSQRNGLEKYLTSNFNFSMVNPRIELMQGYEVWYNNYCESGSSFLKG
jgi:hypothetical protein